MIRILPPAVADKIAAGEVVERPASVVKELVENAIDARAKRIRVDVQEAGKRLIRVTDDGSGIPADEAALAFHRYSTSKIATAEDLEHITTLGFRGEALASIAAVARVSLLTGTDRDQPGVLVRVEGGRVLGVEPRAGRRGTVVTVENLFYNTPARWRFLKSDATEMAHITRLVSAYALAYPEISFALYAGSKRRFHSPGSGKLHEAIIATWGLETAQAMHPVELDWAGIRVHGYIGGRSLSRADRGQLLLFVNRRWVQHALLARAVENAYKGLLPSGKHPVAVLNIELDPAVVDVNVHPAKREVRFHRLRDVLEAVERAVRGALAQEVPTPIRAPVVPTVPGAPPRGRRPSRAMVRLALEAQRPPETPEEKTGLSTEAGLPPLRVVGQVRQTYIVAEGPDGMYLIDQHVAHERVLYEELQNQPSQIASQGLLEPLTIELSPDQATVWEEYQSVFNTLGFVLEPFGEKTILVRAVPAMLAGGDVAACVLEILGELEEGPADAREHRTRASLACHSAVKAGQTLSMQEMRELVRQLEQTAEPRRCPHGRPIFVHLSWAWLEKQLGRSCHWDYTRSGRI